MRDLIVKLIQVGGRGCVPGNAAVENQASEQWERGPTLPHPLVTP